MVHLITMDMVNDQSNSNTHKSPSKEEQIREDRIAGIYALSGVVILFTIIFALTMLGVRQGLKDSPFGSVPTAWAQEKATESIPVEQTPEATRELFDIKIPAVSNEVLEKRTETTQTFKNPDGSETLRVYQTPIFQDKAPVSWFTNTAWAITATTNAGKDGFTASNAPTTNTGSNTYLDCQTGTNIYNCLLSFTTPDLTGYTVSSAAIVLREADARASDNNGGLYLNVHRASTHETDWSESQMTHQIALAGASWSTPGGDWTAQPINYMVPNATNLSVNSWQIYGSGTPNPLTSISGSTVYSFWFRYASSSTDELFSAHSDEVATVAYRPYLEIVYSIAASPPTITSIDPTEGLIDTTVTITGTNFTTDSLDIKIGTLSLNDQTFLSSTSLTGKIPEGASDNYIVVTATGGTATSSQIFNVQTQADQELAAIITTNTRLGYLIALFTLVVVFAIFDFMRRTYIKATNQ